MSKNIQRYLGDDVYATFDGSSIVLTIGGGLKTHHSAAIYLDTDIISALEDFRKDVVEDIVKAGIGPGTCRAKVDE